MYTSSGSVLGAHVQGCVIEKSGNMGVGSLVPVQNPGADPSLRSGFVRCAEVNAIPWMCLLRMFCLG